MRIRPPLRQAVIICVAAAALAGCGGGGGGSHSAHKSRAALKAEMQRERAGASFQPPSRAVIVAAGRTPSARDATARAELLRAAADLQSYHRKHRTFAIGTVRDLHRLDRRTGLVDFVDGRQTSFYLAVKPPATTTTWRYNFDHNKGKTACGPIGGTCPSSRTWTARAG